MKILYKVWIKDQQDCIGEFLFDRYDAIEEWLEDNFGEGKNFKLKEFKLMTLIKCNGCETYIRLENHSLIKKSDYTINSYCLKCAPDYEMDIKPFIKN